MKIIKERSVTEEGERREMNDRKTEGAKKVRERKLGGEREREREARQVRQGDER